MATQPGSNLAATPAMARLAVFVSLWLVARTARADDAPRLFDHLHDAIEQEEGLGAVYLITTVTFATLDLVRARPGKTYGAIELAINAPLAALATYGAAAADRRTDSIVFGAMALASAGLAVHGVYTIAARRSNHDHAIVLTPVARPDAVGAAIAGRF